jgi:predicted enzyme involved in methoxymalonyl-ACP biosynthesis
MLGTAVRSLRGHDGAGAIRATFRPTERNALVATLLADHGFEPTHADEHGEHHVLPAGRSIDVPAHITVVEP